MVTREDYEEYLMMQADGELDAAAAAELQVFLTAHPELSEVPDAWQALKLEADTAIVFEAKDALLKKDPKLIAFVWRPQVWVAAAAIIVALMISFLWRSQRHELLVRKPSIQRHKPAEATPVSSPAVVVSERREPVRKQTSVSPVAASHAVARGFARDTLFVPDALISRPFDALPVVAVAQIMQVVPIVAAVAVPQETTYQSRESALPAIHLAEANQPALNMLKQGLDARVSQITHAAKAIRETTLAVRIGNKNHYLNF